MQKVQFDTEFKIYYELWQELCKVRVASLAVGRHNDSPSLQDKRKKNFDAAVESLNSSVEMSRPFFAASIAKQLLELTSLIKEENDRYEKDREERGGRMITAKSVRDRYINQNIIRGKIDDICESIRKWFNGTAVTGREDSPK
jgi:hypothetical protein